MNLASFRHAFAVCLPLALAACSHGVASVPPGGDIPAAPLPVKPRMARPTPRPTPTGSGSSATPTPPAAPRALTAAEIGQIVAAPDRTDDDKKLDAGRKPDKLLAFLGVGPGMNVGEIGAGFGYTTELLARAVSFGGANGKVYAQNSPDLLKRFLDKGWADRLARPADKNVVREDRDFDSPFPPDVKNLDLVVSVLFYHDTVWLGTDRDKMNKAVYDALKPGGFYVVVDHSAKQGSGTKDVKTLHRIEESVVKDEVQKAGFKLVGSDDSLRNGQDKRDWNDAPGAADKEGRRGTSDRFVLKFQK